ncbi:MAG: helix-turn-helix transcriptional regulator [Oscillospiraceae bacterium]|nr:helix-turn-helix transcriptional regulator [Oscillospiraceae bacterium]
MSTCEEIGNRIRHLRNMHDLTQKELSEMVEAKNLSCSREVVNQWEGGRRDIKTAYTVALAEIFNVTCDYLLRGIESENVDICQKTGLTQNCIDALQTLHTGFNSSGEVPPNLPDKWEAVEESYMQAEHIAREYIINTFIRFVCANWDTMAQPAVQAGKSFFEYLFDCKEAGQRLFIPSFVQKDLSASKYEASESFSIFFKLLLADPSFIKQISECFSDGETIEQVIAFATKEKMLREVW